MKKIIVIGLSITAIFAAVTAVFFLSRTSSDTKENKRYDENNVGEIYYASIDPDHVAKTDSSISYADNEILLVAREGVSFSKIEKLVKGYDLKIVGYIEQTGDYQLMLDRSASREELEHLAEELTGERGVEDAYLDHIFFTQTESIDPGDNWEVISDPENMAQHIQTFPDDLVRLTNGWGASTINASLAWEYMESLGDSVRPIRVGLIDSGFDISHEDLRFAQYFYDGGNNDSPETFKYKDGGHGTHVAGIMAASGVGSTGICGIYPYGVNEDQTSNLYGVSFRGITDKKENACSSMMYKIGYSELILRDVKVINTSLGQGNVAAGYNDPQYLKDLSDSAVYLGDFLIRLHHKGYDFVLVTSAGNDSDDYVISLAYDAKQEEYILDENSMTVGYDAKGKRTAVSKSGEDYYYHVSINGDVTKEYKVTGITDPSSQVFDPSKDPEVVDGHIDAYYNSCLTAIPNSDSYKDLYERIIVVGSVDKDLNMVSYSNAGKRVDIFAPGLDIYSTLPDDSYGPKGGTSMAAPHVAGVAADVWAVNDSLTGAEVKKIVCENVNSRSREGVPVVDAFGAVKAAAVYKGTGKAPSGKDPGVVMGWVVSSAELDENGINKTLEGASVKLTSADGEYIYVTSSDKLGHFEAIVPEGSYALTVTSPEGYEDPKELSITVSGSQVKYLDDWIRLDPDPLFQQELALKRSAEAQATGNISIWAYNDYDGDGNFEAFAVIGDSDKNNTVDEDIVRTFDLKSFYFVDHNGNVSLVKEKFSGDICTYRMSDQNEIDGRRFFSVTVSAGGSYSTGLLFGVDGDNYFEPDVSCNYSSFNFDDPGKAYAVESSFGDEGGHFWYDHEMSFDEDTKEFTVSEEKASY